MNETRFVTSHDSSVEDYVESLEPEQDIKLLKYFLRKEKQ